MEIAIGRQSLRITDNEGFKALLDFAKYGLLFALPAGLYLIYKDYLQTRIVVTKKLCRYTHGDKNVKINFTFPCSKSVRLTKAGKPLEGESSDELSFTIGEVKVADSGVYTISSRSLFGFAGSEKIELRVAPRVNVFEIGEAEVGEPVELKCEVLPDTASVKNVRWEKKGEAIEINGRYRGGSIETPSLEILTVHDDDFGRYTCVIETSAGDQVRSKELALLKKNDIFDIIILAPEQDRLSARTLKDHVLSARDETTVALHDDVFKPGERVLRAGGLLFEMSRYVFVLVTGNYDKDKLNDFLCDMALMRNIQEYGDRFIVVWAIPEISANYPQFSVYTGLHYHDGRPDEYFQRHITNMLKK